MSVESPPAEPRAPEERHVHNNVALILRYMKSHIVKLPYSSPQESSSQKESCLNAIESP